MSKSIPKPHNSGYVLALAFCDYLKDKTGTPKAIMASQQAMASHGISYVYLHSVKKTLFRDDQMLFANSGLRSTGWRLVFSVLPRCARPFAAGKKAASAFLSFISTTFCT